MTLDGNGGACRIGIPPVPEWWSLAACRGTDPDEWIVRRGDHPQRSLLLSHCRRCPVAGDCLEEALTLDRDVRHFGAMRCGTSGRNWLAVEQLVAELEPSTPDEWSVLSAWIVDGEVKTSPQRRSTAA